MPESDARWRRAHPSLERHFEGGAAPVASGLVETAIATLIAVAVLLIAQRRWRRAHPDAGLTESRRHDIRVAAKVAIVGFGIVGLAALLELLSR
jgi:hypothetical protein